MRRAILGVLIVAGLVTVTVGLFGQRNEALAQRLPATPAGNGELIVVPTPLGDKGQMLTVIDPRSQTIGVYSVELPGGRITLRSVRNITWDLQMTEFNGDNPLPREIRSQLEQR